MNNNTIWYFAYGSNLSKDQMKERLGRVPEARIARLPGYRVAFNKRGQRQGQVYANIVEQDGGEVWGVVYQLRPDELRVLDDHEGADQGHYRRDRIEVITETGDTVKAETYFAGERWLCSETEPSREYACKILAGAREHGLPEEYVRSLERLTGTQGS
jgi:cation transport regulator ChaC